MIKDVFMKLLNLNWLTMNRVSCFFLLLSLMFVMMEIQACFKIEGFSYLYILMLYLVGILVHEFCSKFLRNIRRIILFTSIILVFLLVIYFKSPTFAKFLQYCFIDSFREIEDSLSKSLPIHFGNLIPYLSIIIPVLIAVIKYFDSIFPGVITVASTLLSTIYLWYLGYDMNIKNLLFPYVLVSIAVCGGGIYKRNSAGLQKRGYKISTLKKSIAVQICINTILISGSIVLMVESLGVKNIFQIADEIANSKQNIEDNIRKNGYNLTLSGYGGRLGGPVNLNRNVAFRVRGDKPYYLRGTVKDYYDGSSWKKSDMEYTKLTEKIPIDYHSKYFISCMQGADSEETENEDSNYIKTKRIIIYPETLYSPTFFTPNFTYNAGMGSGNVGFDDAGIFVLLSRNAVRKPYFADFFVSSAGVEFLSWNPSSDVGMNYKADRRQSTDDEEYYEDNIAGKYSKYLELPGNISIETYNLVEKLTKDCSSSEEKVRRIRSFLLDNYKYSLDMPETPDGKEFVDYFLFTEKEGYCTYFATAAAVMCRIAGIPSRYVEGFMMEDEKDSDGLYIVTNNMAHAWTEVLFSPEADIWTIVDAVPPAYETVIKNYSVSKPIITGRNFEKSNYLMNEDEEEWDGTDNFDSGENRSLALPLIYILIIIGLSLFLYLIFSVNRYRRKLRYIIESKSMIPLYIYSKKRLQAAGIKVSPEINDDKLLDSIDDYDFKSKMSSFFYKVYEEFYSKHGMIDFDNNKFIFELEDFIRKKQSFIMYHIKKYLC